LNKLAAQLIEQRPFHLIYGLKLNPSGANSFFTSHIENKAFIRLSNPRTVTRNRTELANGLYLFGSSLVSSRGIDVASDVVSAATRGTQGLQSSPKLLCFARNRFRQACNNVAKRTSLILANLADQAFIGSDKPAIVLDRQGQKRQSCAGWSNSIESRVARSMSARVRSSSISAL
jgi:hypothetical protein